MIGDEGRAVLDVVSNYAKSWTLLLKYDEQQLSVPRGGQKVEQALDHQQVKESIAVLKTALVKKEEASDLFGQERGEQLQGILGSINQTFDGHELYPSITEKAAHLLYFIIKDHPFSDGNKFKRHSRYSDVSGKTLLPPRYENNLTGNTGKGKRAAAS